MTTETSTQIDGIFRKHMAAVGRLDGTWIDVAVFRYALAMALQELAESVQPQEQPKTETSEQHFYRAKYEQLTEWLRSYGLLDYHNTDESRAVDTAIELMESQRVELAELRQHNESMYEHARVNQALTAELANLRAQLAHLEAERGTQPHTGNGAGLLEAFDRCVVNPPTVAAAAEPAADDDWQTRIRMCFADNAEVLDWYESLAAGRNTFRNLPKDVRWQLLAFVLRSLRGPDGTWPAMSEFDRNRPEWMSTSAAAVLTFGNGKWQSIIVKAAEL